MSLTDDARTAYVTQKAAAKEQRLEETKAAKVLAESAFVKRFGWAPTCSDDFPVFEVDDLTFRYSKTEGRIRFAMRSVCQNCDRIHWEEVLTIAGIGRLLLDGPRWHDCTFCNSTPDEQPTGPEDRLITALADLIDQYSPR
jgi:hypothetical protein